MVSQHITEITLKKAMSLLLFLRLMHNRDDINNTEVNGEMMASTLAERAGSLLPVSRSFVYRPYKKWRDGQELRSIESKEKGGSLMALGGLFRIDVDHMREDFF